MFVPETDKYSISASAKIFSQYCNIIPEETSITHLEYIANKLMNAVERIAQQAERGDIQDNRIIEQHSTYLEETDIERSLRVTQTMHMHTLQRVDGTTTVKRVIEVIPTSTNPIVLRGIKRYPCTQSAHTEQRLGHSPPSYLS